MFCFFIIYLIILIEFWTVNAVINENNNIFIIKCGKIYITLNNSPLNEYVRINDDKVKPNINDL